MLVGTPEKMELRKDVGGCLSAKGEIRSDPSDDSLSHVNLFLPVGNCLDEFLGPADEQWLGEEDDAEKEGEQL